MSRYIDAEKLVERIKASLVFKNMGEDGYFLRGCVCDLIDMQPTVDAKKFNHGKWVKSDYPQMLVCSSCRDTYIEEDWLKSNKWHYCPRCGAKMDGKEREA